MFTLWQKNGYEVDVLDFALVRGRWTGDGRVFKKGGTTAQPPGNSTV
jgi:hypothetical protein